MKSLAIEIENPSPRYTMPIFFFLMIALAAASIMAGQPQNNVDAFSDVQIY